MKHLILLFSTIVSLSSIAQTKLANYPYTSNSLSLVNFEKVNIFPIHTESDDLMVYSDPANGIFNVLMLGDYGQVQSIYLFNMMGERIYNSELHTSLHNLSGTPAGVYFIHINSESKIKIKKIIIKYNVPQEFNTDLILERLTKQGG